MEVKEKELGLSTVVCKKCYRLVDRPDKALDEIACLKSRFKRIEETPKNLQIFLIYRSLDVHQGKVVPRVSGLLWGNEINGYDHVSRP